MTRIGLLSDTHGYLDPAIFRHFESCDEVWHGGDFGGIELANQLSQFKPLKGVYGNIDGSDIRNQYPLIQAFTCEAVNVYITHIGGYPKKYAPGVKAALLQNRSGIFISGHSHILKIMYDDQVQCLHMNPGAAGKQGWHKVRTLVRFTIDGHDIRDCQVIELGPR
ncbi:MAG TPA: metallophosphoesterase family protein [Flavisolibacter sp.]|nr:metallophosphoesterase family protein [Flavisolibacter sp.]